ncbi:MAG: TetR/AcrR family transcriptional regulator, partial [Oxalobacteraceae bacterium]
MATIQHASTPRRVSGDDRRTAIAIAARDLIVEKGVEGLRTRDIADRVGINIATLHYHVPTKEALIGLVAETMKNEFRVQSIVRPRAHLSAVERLEHEFYDFHEMFTEQPEIIIVMNELNERSRRDPVVKAAMAPLHSHWHGMVADIFADGRDEGSFRPDLDPKSAATIFLGALLAFCRSGDTSNDTYTRLCAELRRFARNPELIED